MRTNTPRSTPAAAAVLLTAVLAGCAGDGGGGPAATAAGPLLTTAIFQKPTKTAEGYLRREVDHAWTLEKRVSPASAQIAPGSGATFHYTLTATRTVAATRETAGVRGEICVRNLGSVASEGMTVADQVQASTNGGATWTTVATRDVDVSGNPVVDPGETACFAYDVPLAPVAGALYRNRGSVTWTNAGNGGVPAPGTTQEWETAWVPFTFPADPATAETDQSAALADLLDCPAGFTCTPSSGAWTLTGTRVIEYSVRVANVSAPCGHRVVAENTATLTAGDSGRRETDTASVALTTEDCAPPPSTQGCTPGYWKQTQHFGNWAGYVPTGPSASRYQAVFGVSLFPSSRTLLDALRAGGGGAARLGRHSTAALLNAANGSVDYGMTPAQVIAAVQAAASSGDYGPAADMFEAYNERTCPLGRAP
jgi:hypothetical protein